LWEAFEEDAHPPPSDVQTGQSIRFSKRRWQKCILNKYGYPPDLQEEAVKTVLMQAELLCADWV
jgi:hypothetical protein